MSSTEVHQRTQEICVYSTDYDSLKKSDQWNLYMATAT